MKCSVEYLRTIDSVPTLIQGWYIPRSHAPVSHHPPHLPPFPSLNAVPHLAPAARGPRLSDPIAPLASTSTNNPPSPSYVYQHHTTSHYPHCYPTGVFLLSLPFAQLFLVVSRSSELLVAFVCMSGCGGAGGGAGCGSAGGAAGIAPVGAGVPPHAGPSRPKDPERWNKRKQKLKHGKNLTKTKVGVLLVKVKLRKVPV